MIAEKLRFYRCIEKSDRFDLVISFDAPSRQAVFKDIINDLQDKYPDVEFALSMDMDYGEL